MKSELSKVTQQHFEETLQICLEYYPQDFSGPYIHSIPIGNMFADPVRQTAYCYRGKTILLKVEDITSGSIEYFAVSKSRQQKATE